MMPYKGRGLLVLAVICLVVLVGGGASVVAADPPAATNLVIYKYALAAGASPGDAGGGAQIEAAIDGAALAGITFQLDAVTLVGADPNDIESYAVIDGGNALTATTDAQGQCTFSALPQGIYKVTELTSAANLFYNPTAPFLVQLPMKNTSTGQWLETVYAYPKSEALSVEMFAGAVEQQYGTVNLLPDGTRRSDWFVRVRVPKNLAAYASLAGTATFAVECTLPTSLFVDAVTVNGLRSDGSQGTLGDPVYYAKEVNGSNFNTVTLHFKAAKFTELATYDYLLIAVNANLQDAVYANYATGVGDPHHTAFTGSATLRCSYVNGGDTVSRTYTNQASPEIHFGKVGVIVSASVEDMADMAGNTTFAIALTDEAGESDFLVDNEGKKMIATLNENGQAVFPFLPYNPTTAFNDAATTGVTYYIYQMSVPDGYLRMSEPVAVTYAWYPNASAPQYFATVRLTGSKFGFELPGTGGIGYWPFIVGGLLLLAMATVLIVGGKGKKALRRK